MTTATRMSNAVARRYFLHDGDTHADGQRCCYFSQLGYDSGDRGWGFWVREDGTVDTDELASGKLPSLKIVNACVRAAVRHLNR